jgi:hypothetical protein
VDSCLEPGSSKNSAASSNAQAAHMTDISPEVSSR